MMDNSLPTSNCQAIGESISKYVQQEERAGLKEEAATKQTTMTTNTEANKENDDQEITTQVENIATSTTIDKTINENSVTYELGDCESEAERKSSKDHGGTIKLMQDVKESEIDSKDESRITNDETRISNTSTNHERGGAKKSVCWTIFCGSKNSMIAHERHSMIMRERKRSRRRRRRSTLKVRKNPIPTKEWEYLYRRRLIRQNAFCGIWPENL